LQQTSTLRHNDASITGRRMQALDDLHLTQSIPRIDWCPGRDPRKLDKSKETGVSSEICRSGTTINHLSIRG
jgi:hypothetical protein